ncbi:MAG: hypothetical protein IBGAMO2_740025 [Arenicellales bacterium IbO2]|nr:MAG: hypothetical protein IBGAMO2_740025 [Arenicellales bacterium IbO2]
MGGEGDFFGGFIDSGGKFVFNAVIPINIQTERKMIVTAWTNGQNGYGIKVNDENDRKEHFRREWGRVLVELPNGKVAEPNIDKDSFWRKECGELICSTIKEWLKEAGKHPWPPDNLPKFELVHVEDKKFRLVDK